MITAGSVKHSHTVYKTDTNVYCRVTIQKPLYREVFWHEYAKIPRHTSQNAITEGDYKCILARNCEGTEQLHCREKKRKKQEIVLQSRHESGYCLLVISREVFCVSEGHRKPETYRTNLCD